jgi:hypothetical protein
MYLLLCISCGFGAISLSLWVLAILWPKHDDFDAKIKEINEFLTRHLQSSEDSEKQIEELKDRVSALEYQIKKFNSSRHWWERKLKIKE